MEKKNRLVEIEIFILFLCLSCFLSVYLFQLPSNDLYYYHYYNGWAFLHNRIDIDFLPSLTRTYYNPLYDALMYFTVEKLNNHPLVLLFVSSLKYGILMFVCYKVYDFVFKNIYKDKIFAELFSIITAASSPILLCCITFESNDIQSAILIMLAFYFLLKNLFKENCKSGVLIFCGVLTGLVVGLKYTNIVYAASLPLVILALKNQVKNPFKKIGMLILGMFFGFLITNGYWTYLLWTKFRNPVFPYLNNIFHSPFGSDYYFLYDEMRHLLPKNIFEYIFYPLLNSAERLFVGIEFKYFDLKSALTFAAIAAFVFLLKSTAVKNRINKITEINVFYALIYFVGFTYYINLLIFANIRYIIPLFMLAPVIIYIFFAVICNKKMHCYAIIMILLLYAVTYKSRNSISKNIPWLSPHSVIQIQNLNIEDNSTVLCGTFMACYIAPAQNPNAQYIGFVMPENLSSKGFYNKDIYNMYYKNKYLENHLGEIFKDSKNLYFIYSNLAIGLINQDLPLLEQGLSKYSNGEITKIRNCQTVEYSVFGHRKPIYEIYVCKLK